MGDEHEKKYLYFDFAYTNSNGLVERELINGKMKIIREVSYGEDNQILEREQEYYRNSELWQLDHPHWYWLGGHNADQWLDGV